MKKKLLLYFLLISLQTTTVVGQYATKIFPQLDNKTKYYCKETILRFQDDPEDSLILKPKIYFSIDNEPINSDNFNYYRFKLTKDTLANYSGYLRKNGEKILVIPIDSSISQKNERILFAFDAKIGHSWQIYQMGVFDSDSIKYIGKKYDTDLQDYVYEYFVSDCSYNYSINKLYISEKKGLVKVIFLTHYRFCIECIKK